MNARTAHRQSRNADRVLLTLAVLTIAAVPAAAQSEKFTLVRAVPSDVFVCIEQRTNPDREFLRKYWDEVWQAFLDTGVSSDVTGFVASLLSEEQQAEMDRLKALATKLYEGVDWQALASQEMVFAERMAQAMQMPGGGVNMGPPDFIWLLRGSKAEHNFTGLVAIMESAIQEINKAAGKPVLEVERTDVNGNPVARINLFKNVQGPPAWYISLGRHGDIIVMGAGTSIFGEVMDLLDQKGNVPSLASQPRYREAFSKLPEAEDGKVFFDMQAMLKPFRGLLETIAGAMGDSIQNRTTNPEALKLIHQSVQAYGQKDYPKALELIKQAHKVAPDSPIVLYNLACFSALNGDKNAALDWLDKAVDAGFYSPSKIATDSDLTSLRDDKRYDTILAKAHTLAANAGKNKKQEAIWRTVAQRIFDGPAMFDYSATVEYTKGYSTYSDTIAALVPGASDNPFYPVVGNPQPFTKLGQYLPEETLSYSVNAGVDLNALYDFVIKTIQMVGPEGQQTLDKWDKMQQEIGVNVRDDILSWLGSRTRTVSLQHDRGGVLMLQVRNDEKAKSSITSAIDFIVKNMQEQSAQNPMLAMFMIRTAPLNDDELPGFQSLMFGMSPQPIVWGVRDGQLMFGSNADAVKLCLATAAGKHPSIKDNQRIMKEAIVPDQPFVSATLTDQRNLGREMSQLIGALSMGSGMFTMFIQDVQTRQTLSKVVNIIAKLGPAVSKIDFIKSKSTATTFDGKAWHTKMVTHYVSPEEHAAPPPPAE